MDKNRNGEERGLAPYPAATKHLSPELRETLYRVFARNGLQEDDPLWGILAADAELMQAFLSEIQRIVDAVGNASQQAVTSQAQQVAALERSLIQRLEQLQRDHEAAHSHQAELLAARVEEIRQRETKLAAAKAETRQKTFLQHGITAVVTALAVGSLALWLDGKRLEEAAVKSDDRYAKTIVGLRDAARFVAQIQNGGGSVVYTRTPGQRDAAAIVINFGDIRKISQRLKGHGGQGGDD